MIRSQPVRLAAVLLGVFAPFASWTPGLAGGASGQASPPQSKGGVLDGPSSWELRKESGWSPANLSLDEAIALEVLCGLALQTKGGAWHSERINAAISVLVFGADPPDNLQATVYKTCGVAVGSEPVLP